MSTLAIIQARYGSHRFPGKMLADLHGQPVIQHVYERAKQIRGVDRVLLALHDSEDEQPLITWAKQAEVEHVAVKGLDVNDVLGRFVRAADEMPEADTIMRLTGDCPMLQPNVCSRLLGAWRFTNFGYGWLDTHSGVWPDGLDTEVFKRELLLQANSEAKAPSLREHVTGWLRQNTAVYSLPSDPAYRTWPKVSVDFPQDLEVVKAWMQQH